MLQEKNLNHSKRHNKENSSLEKQTKHATHNILQSAIQTLKNELVLEQNIFQKKQKDHQQQIMSYQKEIEELKKKLNSLNQKYLLNSIIRSSDDKKSNRDTAQMVIREGQIKLDQLRTDFRRCEDSKKQILNENQVLKKQIVSLKMEKEKLMEMGLIEKIQLQEKNKILQDEVKSKKGIINSMKKQLQKMSQSSSEIVIRERKVCQKGKDLINLEREITQSGSLNLLKMQSKIDQLERQNQFLKGYVKKVQKLAKKGCPCQARDQKIKKNLFQIKRQLALAKVELGKSLFSENRKIGFQNKLKGGSSSSDSQQVSGDEDSNSRSKIQKR